MAKKHISITNDRVLDALEGSKNASKLIEKAVIFYLDAVEKDYATKEYVDNLYAECNKMFKICNQNYIQMKYLFDEMAKETYSAK